jgi:hypothetical protein
VRVPVALAAWLNAQRKRGLIELNEPRMAAGVLLGKMISEPQRAVFLRQRRPLMSSREITKRAKICAGLFLEGCKATAPAANTTARNM